MLPWQHLLPGIVEKLISSNPCRILECNEPQKGCLSPRNINKQSVILKNQKVAITHLAIGIDTQVTHHVVAMEKVAE